MLIYSSQLNAILSLFLDRNNNYFYYYSTESTNISVTSDILD